eukprot:727838_1
MDATPHNNTNVACIHLHYSDALIKKYEITVQQSRHPGLNDYIAKALMEGVYPFLCDATLNKFVILLKHKQEMIEKYVFDIEIMIGKAKYMETQQQIKLIKSLRRKLRDLLVKLNTINSRLNHMYSNNNAQQLTFTIQSHVKQFDNTKHTKWIQADCDNNDHHHKQNYQ